MAVNVKDIDSKSPYETLTTDPDKDQRRKAALRLFRQYLIPEEEKLVDQKKSAREKMRVLNYSDAQMAYVLEAVDHLALAPSTSNKGLEGRSERETSSGARVSLVDSSQIGVGEFILGLPTNLSWIARQSMSPAESSGLEQMGALMRITAVDPSLLSDDHDDRLVKILHARDQFPGIGLRPEGMIANIARKIGRGATYAVERANGLADVQINLQVPGSKSIIESWRELPANATGLHFFGRVPAL